MRGLVRKAHNLVFYRWAVARPDTIDDARIHRRFVQRSANNVVSLFGRLRDEARNLPWVIATSTKIRKHRPRIVAGLFEHRSEIERLAIEPRWRASLEASDPKRQLTQALGQACRRRIANTTTGFFDVTHQHAAGEKGARRQHNSAGPDLLPLCRNYARNAIAFQDQVVNRVFCHRQARLILEQAPNCPPVKLSVRLRPGCTNRRTPAGVKRSKLDARLVDRNGHRAAQSVDLFGQVPFAYAANSRVAAHLPKRRELVRR